MAKTNFDYLKKIDKNLYEIMLEAERLYRSEFFEQCMGQTRRFGEHLCRNVLGKDRTNEVTFDEMLATLKDKLNHTQQEKEFIDDLYFLKKQGNISVHSGEVKKDGMTAFECLHRSFEAGLNYAVNYKKAGEDLLKLNYDTELLVTGTTTGRALSERYEEEKEKTKKAPKKKTSSKPKTQRTKPQVSSINSVPRRTGIPPFWAVVGVFFVIALITLIYILA